MADELITYGMVRDKGHTVNGSKIDEEYAIKEDFQISGAVGLIRLTNLKEYESNELIKNSSIPLAGPYFHINANRSGDVYLSNLSLRVRDSPSNLPSIFVVRGLNKVNLPVTVGTPAGVTTSLTIGDRIYFYGDPDPGLLGNTRYGSYIIADKGETTITIGGGFVPIDPDPDPDPVNSMTINFSGVLPNYSYSFAVGAGFVTGIMPFVVLINGPRTYNIPMSVYDPSTGSYKNVSSGTVSIFRESTLDGSNRALVASFNVLAGTNIAVYVG